MKERDNKLNNGRPFNSATASAAAKKSWEARRAKKAMLAEVKRMDKKSASNILKDKLEEEVTLASGKKATKKEAILDNLITTAAKGSIAALELILRLTGENMPEKIEVTNKFDTMSDAELDAEIALLKSKLS